MKKICYISIILFLFFSSCNSSQPKEKKKARGEDKFIELISQRIDSINSSVSSNPIQAEKNKKKQSYYSRQFFNIVSRYTDSIQIIKNWNGIVTNFEYKKGEKSSFIKLDIEIEYKGDNFISYPKNKIVLRSIYPVENEMKDKDIVFNKMAEINNNANVYIVGFFNKNMNGNVSVGNNLREFNFSILNISRSPIDFSMSSNMSEAVKCKFKEMNILGRGMLNNKSEKEIKKEVLYLKNDSIRTTLNNDEIALIDKIEKLYVLNLAREYIKKH